MKKIPKLPEGAKLIRCSSLELTSKDIITIESWEDFLYILGQGTIYKLKNTLYILSDTVAHIYILEDD